MNNFSDSYNNMEHDQRSDLKTFLLFFACFSLSFFIIYFPIIVFTVFTGDDFNYYFHWNNIVDKYPSWFTLDTHHWLTDVFLLIGRPLANPIHCVSLRSISNLSNYPLMRSVSVLLAALIASIFSFSLWRLKLKKSLAFLTSFCVFALPGMMFYVTYYSFSLSWLIALSLAIAGTELAGKINVDNLSKRKILTGKNIVLAFLSFCTIIVSLLIYQPATMFFVVCTATLLVFSERKDWAKTRVLLIRNLSIFIISISAYFFLYKFVLLPYFTVKHPVSAHVLNTVMPQYQFSLSKNIAEKITHLKNINILSLSLWNMFPNVKIAFSVLVLIFIGLLANFIHAFLNSISKKESWSRVAGYYLQNFIFIGVIYLVINGPNLSAGGLVMNRQIFPYSALVVIFLTASLIQIASLFNQRIRSIVVTSVMCILAIGAGFLTYDRVLRWITVNHVLEDRFIQYHLAKQIKNGTINVDNTKEVNYIQIISAPWGVTFTGVPFGIVDEIHSASARPDKIAGLLHFSLMKLGINWDKVEILNEGIGAGSSQKDKVKFYVIPSNPAPKSNLPNRVIIDMNDLLIQKKELLDNNTKVGTHEYNVSGLIEGKDVKVIESSSGTGHVAYRAFDNSTAPDDFWETGGFPQWIKIVYPEANEIMQYEFQAGYTEQGSMPKDWKLQGSNDGMNWEIVDNRINQTDWNVYENRVYIVERPSAYKYYRFYFISGNRQDHIRIYEIKIN